MLLDVSRSSLYYRPKGEGTENLALIRRMDPAVHAAHGDGGGLPAVADQRGEPGAPDRPLPTAWPRHLVRFPP